jgi:membrane-associated phospholipid phosphatase
VGTVAGAHGHSSPRHHPAPVSLTATLTPRRLALLAIGLALLSALSIAYLDVTVARAVAGLPAGVRAVSRTGTDGLDLASTKALGNSVLGLTLLGLAAVLAARPARRALAARLAVVGLANLLAHLASSLGKSAFGRLRPYVIAEQGWNDLFFAGGRSFPSGHTAYYLGLALPCALLFRRGWIALVPALFVAVSRVLVNEHFPGDVLASLSIVCAVTAGLLALFARLGWIASE